MKGLLAFMLVLFSIAFLVAAQMHQTHYLSWAGNNYSENTLYTRNLIAATGKDTSKVFFLAINENPRKLSKQFATTLSTTFWATESDSTDSMFNVIYLDLANYKNSSGGWTWYPWDNSNGIWDTLKSTTSDKGATMKRIKQISTHPYTRVGRFRVVAAAASGDTCTVGGEVGLTFWD